MPTLHFMVFSFRFSAKGELFLRGTKGLFDLLGNVMPSGWYYQEKLNFCTLSDKERQGVMDPVAKVISPSKLSVNTSEVTQQIYGGPSFSP
ncbi:MAG: hypothetical protein ACLQLE_11570, partial [Desulfobaccales bacterium]